MRWARSAHDHKEQGLLLRRSLLSVGCVLLLIAVSALAVYFAPTASAAGGGGRAHVTPDLIVKSLAMAIVILAIVFSVHRMRRR